MNKFYLQLLCFFVLSIGFPALYAADGNAASAQQQQEQQQEKVQPQQQTGEQGSASVIGSFATDKSAKSELVQILLGHLSVTDALEQGRLEASTRTAMEVASTIFPQLPVWRPPLDDLPAE